MTASDATPEGRDIERPAGDTGDASEVVWSSWARHGAALILVAIGAAAFAIAFRWTIGLVFRRAYRAEDVLVAFGALPWYWGLLLPACGGGLAGAVSALAARLPGGHGVGQVMEAVVLGKVRISLRLTLVKALASWLAIVTGGSVGREGSIIQFGGGLGAALGRAFRLPESQVRGLIAAGTAAGFAAAYNTPLAAVLFVLEVVMGVIALDVVVPAIIATPIATALTRLVIGGGPIYGLRSFRTGSDVALLLPALLGVLAGICGPAFVVMLGQGERLFQRIPGPRALRSAFGGLLVGALAIELPAITGNGYEAINLILGGKLALALLVILLVGKPLATTASVSSGSPGGVFTPSLFIGAALGGIVGELALRVDPHSGFAVLGGYALIGMAAMTAATTHAPVMAAVMVFELSGDYAVVLPLLVATATATLIARRLREDSIYTEELRRRGTAWVVTLEGRRMRARRSKHP